MLSDEKLETENFKKEKDTAQGLIGQVVSQHTPITHSIEKK